ncbi:MAG: amidohydrolase, partial [Terriglobales bacterium]
MSLARRLQRVRVCHILGGISLGVALMTGAAAAQEGAADGQNAAPDAIFANGNFYTGVVTAQGGVARAQAIAVRGDRIVSVGPTEMVLRLRGSDTQVIDLDGRFAMPGFNDAHVHLASGGFGTLDVNLVGARSLQEMKSRIAARAKSATAGEWLTGRGWDHTLWPGRKLPTRWDLDAVTEGRPAVFTRVDGHIAVANSAALDAADITRDTPDPPGGRIDRDPEGEPTGILREAARGALTAKVPLPRREQRRQAIEMALAEAARWGVTSAQDNSSWEDFLIYEDLEKEGKLTLRITEWLNLRAPLETLEKQRSHHHASDPLLRTGLLKGVLDGTLGSRTAALESPYADDPANTGLLQYSAEELAGMVQERVAAGFQIGLHAIGDAAADMALDAFAAAATAHPSRDLRLRVEHAQVISPEQFDGFRQAGVIASMQPSHLLTDMNWAESRLGRARARYSYAWAEFLKKGVLLAFGTDYPVEPINPFRGLYAAVTRRSESGKAEYYPAQKVTLDQAIAAYT